MARHKFSDDMTLDRQATIEVLVKDVDRWDRATLIEYVREHLGPELQQKGDDELVDYWVESIDHSPPYMGC